MVLDLLGEENLEDLPVDVCGIRRQACRWLYRFIISPLECPPNVSAFCVFLADLFSDLTLDVSELICARIG